MIQGGGGGEGALLFGSDTLGGLYYTHPTPPITTIRLPPSESGSSTKQAVWAYRSSGGMPLTCDPQEKEMEEGVGER